MLGPFGLVCLNLTNKSSRVAVAAEIFELTPLAYWDGKMVEPGAKSPFPQSAHHAKLINLGLLQIRDSPYLFDLIEHLGRGFDKRN